MAITSPNGRFCWVELTQLEGSGDLFQQVLIKESNKVTIRIPDSVNYGSGTFVRPIKFTISLRKESR